MHRKFGTILFRKEGDILTSLLWALGRGQLKENTTYVAMSTSEPYSKTDVLREAANIVNNLIHAEIAKHDIDDIYSQENPNDINHVLDIDEDSWTFLELAATRTNGKSGTDERNAHVKKLC